MSVTVHVLNAFTRDGRGGNPAGVVLDSDGLPEPTMRAVAHRIGLSETVFVQRSTRARFKLRFFTPTDEVDLCGHATIAAFHLMYRYGLVLDGPSDQESRVGVLGVEVRRDGSVMMEQKTPEFFETVSAAELSRALGLPASALCPEGLPAQIVSTGLRDIIVPVADRRRLLAAKPDWEELKKLTWSYDVVGVHAFALDGLRPGSAAHSRNFAPLYGIPEESATGSSTGALACYLARQGRLPASARDLVFEQGDSLGLPSEILARLERDGGRVHKVWVGGEAAESADDPEPIEVDAPINV